MFLLTQIKSNIKKSSNKNSASCYRQHFHLVKLDVLKYLKLQLK